MTSDSVATVKDSVFKNNTSTGMTVLFSMDENGQLTLVNDVLEGHETNSSLIMVGEGSVLLIEDSTIQDNTIYTSAGKLKIN